MQLFTLANARGMEVRITDYGGIVVSVKVPDRRGRIDDVVLGLDPVEHYRSMPHPYFGAIVGRVANRIAGARFELGGIEYRLARNDGEQHLHGGLRGFDKVIWDARLLDTSRGPALELAYLSSDGEEGYPGNLAVKVTYTLTADNELVIDYSASTDRETVVNLTNHSYFNLAGGGDVLDHRLTIYADQFLPVDAYLIPTGELRSVAGTAFDFTRPTTIGARIESPDEQIRLGRGYDHTWVPRGRSGEMRLAAEVLEPVSGRVLRVFTSHPGVHLYTGNFLDGSIAGRGGMSYHRRSGFCLETQHFPNAPNTATFPSVALKPGDHYRHSTLFAFSAA